MLNRWVQWTEEGIRISLDPRHAKEIIQELGLEGAKSADTPIIVSQSGKTDNDFRALSLWDATVYQRLVAITWQWIAETFATLHRSGSITPQPRKVQIWSNSREWGDLSLGDRPIGRIGRTTAEGSVRSDHTMAHTDSDWAGRLRFWSRRQKAVSLSSWESELCGVNWGRKSWTPKRAQRPREPHTCDDCVRQPTGGESHSTSGTMVGETRAHETSLTATGEG